MYHVTMYLIYDRARGAACIASVFYELNMNWLVLYDMQFKPTERDFRSIGTRTRAGIRRAVQKELGNVLIVFIDT